MSKDKILKFTFGEEEYIRMATETFKKEFQAHLTKGQNASYDRAYNSLGKAIGFDKMHDIIFELWKDVRTARKAFKKEYYALYKGKGCNETYAEAYNKLEEVLGKDKAHTYYLELRKNNVKS